MNVKRYGKVCFVASSGGHMEELSRLKELMNHNDFILTEKSAYNAIDWCKNIHYIYQINRKEFLFPLKFMLLIFYSLVVLLKEKPDVILSTGALVTIPICYWGKLFGKKIIYIESFARIDNGSLTGKLMYKIADLFIVQWKEMLNVFPKAMYGGGIF